MPITQPDLPLRVLNCFQLSGVGFLVLHEEEKVGTADLISDVDIAINMPVHTALDLACQSLAESGVVIALVWPYDVGGGASVFFSDPEGENGAQIDALYDLRGSGRYGLRSDRFFPRQQVGFRYPTPDRLDALLYVARKAAVKGKRFELDQACKTITSAFAVHLVQDRVRTLFSSSAARSLLRTLRGGQPRWNLRPVRWVKSFMRLLERLRRPIGYWVHIAGPGAEETALALESRFGRWLVNASSGRSPTGLAAMFWWATVVMPVRWRPAVFFSYSENRLRWPQPDMILSSSPTNASLASSIVAAMAQKATR